MKEQFKMMGYFLAFGIELCVWVYLFNWLFNRYLSFIFAEFSGLVASFLAIFIWTYRVYRSQKKIGEKV